MSAPDWFKNLPQDAQDQAIKEIARQIEQPIVEKNCHVDCGALAECRSQLAGLSDEVALLGKDYREQRDRIAMALEILREHAPRGFEAEVYITYAQFALEGDDRAENWKIEQTGL